MDNGKSAKNKEQWYSSEVGKLHLELLKLYFQLNGYEFETSIIGHTQEIEFTLKSGYCLSFPANFPKEMPLIRYPDGTWHDEFHPNFYVEFEEGGCKAVVHKVIEFLQNHPPKINPQPRPRLNISHRSTRRYLRR